MTSQERWIRIFIGVVLCAWIPFLLTSHFFDWDQFYAFQEIDYRAWMVDHVLPLWSYQLCGGVTRLGDPQALGLSPLFGWVMLFGPVWGTKALLYSCWFIGVISLRGWLLLLVPSPGATHKQLAWVVALLAFGSNFFLWHFHVGHVTFALMGLGMGIIYYTWKAWLARLSRPDCALFVLVSFTYYTGGMVQSTLYMMIPLFLALGLALLWQAATWVRAGVSLALWWKKLAAMVGWHALGILLASYKLYGVFAYQQAYPRTIPHKQETLPWLSTLMAHFLPTWDFHFAGLWSVPKTSAYAAWEHSMWSVFPALLLAYGLYRWRKPRPAHTVEPATPTPINAPDPRTLISTFLWVYGVVVILFSLGDVAPFAPHALLNGALHHSVRVIQRYQIGLVFVMALICWRVLLHDDALLQWFRSRLAIPLLVLTALSPLTFWPSLSLKQAGFLAKRKAVRHTPMRWFLLVPHPKGSLPPMHQALQSGLGVVNCYNPLYLDPKAYTKELPHTAKGPKYDGGTGTGQKRMRPLPFVYQGKSKLSKSCLKGSHYKQNKLIIGPTCPARVCVNIRWVNPHHKQPFAFDPGVGKYCRTSTLPPTKRSKTK